MKYCGWGAAFVKRKDFGNLSAAWLRDPMRQASRIFRSRPAQADAIQKRSTKPPPPLHSLQITSELGGLALDQELKRFRTVITPSQGSGVRWSPYTVDPRTGNQLLGRTRARTTSITFECSLSLRWYPAEDETGVAAIAAIFSNQQSTELQEMKRALAV